MTTTEIVTSISIGLTFLVGICNLFVTFRNVRKTTFINSVTASRIKYIQDLRESISRFCALSYSYNTKNYALEREEIWELNKEADTLKFLIHLYLNPEDEYWDIKIITLIDEIILHSDKDPSKYISELITITQYLLKLEWEGAKRESEIGIISDAEKKGLYDKYVEKHQKAISKMKKSH